MVLKLFMYMNKKVRVWNITNYFKTVLNVENNINLNNVCPAVNPAAQ